VKVNVITAFFSSLFTAREAAKLANILENVTLDKSDDYDFTVDFKEA
jgi:hypothetical protein